MFQKKERYAELAFSCAKVNNNSDFVGDKFNGFRFYVKPTTKQIMETIEEVSTKLKALNVPIYDISVLGTREVAPHAVSTKANIDFEINAKAPLYQSKAEDTKIER